MIMSIHPPDPFTKQARERWNKMPPDAQKRILSNVWCGKCEGSVTIMIETAEMKRRDLILKGTCKTCGKTVCRVVEPEPD